MFNSRSPVTPFRRSLELPEVLRILLMLLFNFQLKRCAVILDIACSDLVLQHYATRGEEISQTTYFV
jgi:hypothetical protein